MVEAKKGQMFVVMQNQGKIYKFQVEKTPGSSSQE